MCTRLRSFKWSMFWILSCLMCLPCFLLKSIATLRQLPEPAMRMISIRSSFDKGILEGNLKKRRYKLCMKNFGRHFAESVNFPNGWRLLGHPVFVHNICVPCHHIVHSWLWTYTWHHICISQPLEDETHCCLSINHCEGSDFTGDVMEERDKH